MVSWESESVGANIYIYSLCYIATAGSYTKTLKPCTKTLKPCNKTTPTTSSSTHKMKLGIIAMLCMGLFITVAACVLCRSGDIETNPGPGCECNLCQSFHIINPQRMCEGYSTLLFVCVCVSLTTVEATLIYSDKSGHQ